MGPPMNRIEGLWSTKRKTCYMRWISVELTVAATGAHDCVYTLRHSANNDGLVGIIIHSFGVIWRLRISTQPFIRVRCVLVLCAKKLRWRQRPAKRLPSNSQFLHSLRPYAVAFVFYAYAYNLAARAVPRGMYNSNDSFDWKRLDTIERIFFAKNSCTQVLENDK